RPDPTRGRPRARACRPPAAWAGGGRGPGVAVYPPPTRPASPVSILDAADTHPDLVAFAVRGDVSYLLVQLSNGETVRLQPAAVLGRARPRLTAIATPSQTSITQIRAYSASGELGYTV